MNYCAYTMFYFTVGVSTECCVVIMKLYHLVLKLTMLPVYFCTQNEADVGYCCRGCRLMRLADFTNYGPQNRNTRELLQICTDCELTLFTFFTKMVQ